VLCMHRADGFSLFETVAGLAVASTMAAVTATPMVNLVQGVRLQAITSDLHHHLLLGRSLAVKGGVRMTLCKSGDGLRCSEGGRWDQGWILFEDRNRSGTREPDEALLQQVAALPPDLRINASAPLGRYVSYGAMGMTQQVSGAFQAGTFTVCRASLDRTEARQVVINAGGRPRVQKVGVDGCF
jgi:type IV fimbrial biogenesis protein FimT